MTPIISIALPVYNGAATLKLAVYSILQQSFEDWELILLDDHSSDDSLDIMRTFDDPRIRLVEGVTNIGLSARLNMAVDMAKGIYFARMDQDDISFPDRLEKQFKYLQEHKDIDLLATATLVFRGHGNALGCLPVVTGHEKICAQPYNGFHLPHPTWMGKTDWFRQHRYETFADGAEDQYLLLSSYQLSRFSCLDEPLLAYHEGERALNKMLRARRIFCHVYMRHFRLCRRYAMMAKVLLLFGLKVIADTLYKLGLARARNVLRPLTASEQSKWANIWRQIQSATGEQNR